MIPGKLKMRAFSSDALENDFNSKTNEELKKIHQELQRKCDQTFKEFKKSHSSVEEEIRKLSDLAKEQQTSWVTISFLAPVQQLIAAHTAQKQKQEHEENKLQEYLTRNQNDMFVTLYRTVRYAGEKEGEASAISKINEDLKQHVKAKENERDQMKESEKIFYGENMAQQKDIEWYERDNKRLNAEIATLKGQVKLWQSATLMIIASAVAGATIWISSPNVLPLTESNAVEETSSPNVLKQGSCLHPILDAVAEIRWSCFLGLNWMARQTWSIVCLTSSWEAARDFSLVVPAALSIVIDLSKCHDA